MLVDAWVLFLFEDGFSAHFSLMLCWTLDGILLHYLSQCM